MPTIFYIPNLTAGQLTSQHYELRYTDPHFFDLIAPSGLNQLRGKADKYAATFRGSDKRLDDIQPIDQFYVFGHGDYRDCTIHSKAPGATRIGMVRLAHMLRQQGLQDTPGLMVRLFACTSSVTTGLGGSSMARQLAYCLGASGYQHLQVKGYNGFVNLGDGRNLHVVKEYNANTGSLGNRLLAKDNCVVYDMSGVIVSGQESVGTQYTTALKKHTKFRIR